MQMHASALAGSFKLFLNGQPTGQEHWKCALFGDSEKYKHVEHCVSLVWHWSMCSGKFGQPAAPSERDETVTGAWRTMPNVCKISRKIGNFCRISVTRAWRERDGSVTKHRELCWNTGGKSTVLFPYLQAQTFSHVDWNIPFQTLFLIFSDKSGIT